MDVVEEQFDDNPERLTTLRRIHEAHIFGGYVFGAMISGLLMHFFPWACTEREWLAVLQLAVLAYAIYRGLGWAERRIVGPSVPDAG